jgi:hypothetical protein
MKRSLQVKVWILLGYVLVCTAIVLFEPVEPAPVTDEAPLNSISHAQAPV